jgi:uncharacterized cupredoxin-like copper-binding protein
VKARAGATPIVFAALLGGCAALGLGSKSGPGDPEVVEVEVRDARLDVSPRKVNGEKVILQVVNNGELEHDLRVEGPGLDEPLDTAIAPGQHRRVELRVRGGSYRLYCPDANHAELGIDAKLTVDAPSKFDR